MSADGQGLVSQAGAALLVQAMRVTGLNRGLREAPGQWRAPRAVHDPGKIVADLAVATQSDATCGESLARAVSRPAPACAARIVAGASDRTMGRVSPESGVSP